MTLISWSLRARLTLAFGSLAGLVLAVAALAIYELSDSHDSLAIHVEETALRVEHAAEIVDATGARAVAARNLVLVSTDADRADEARAVQAADARLSQALHALGELLATHHGVAPQEQALFKSLQDQEARYGPVARDIVAKATAGQRDEAVQRIVAECRPLLAALVKDADAYLHYLDDRSHAMVEAAEADYLHNRRLLVGAALLVQARQPGALEPGPLPRARRSSAPLVQDRSRLRRLAHLA
ncbi:MAG: MCP four helix bundle domain-containing protein, partial [Burkholderiales bacterium]|nr:MCP four helix bundle domain-containing protein [Burkholderiales bacterium]